VITLVVRRTIQATPERLFDAWTKPEQLVEWWGPDGVACIAPSVDLRVGGRYRIGNRMPDGSEIWIIGEFETIERPHLLAYTWCLEGNAGDVERVTVRFESQDEGTEVIVTHERVANETLRDQHRQGWHGCLEGLARYIVRS
jgi:glutathione S-transferase